MLATLNALFSLFLSYGVLLMANGLFSTLLGVRSRLEGFDPQVTGLIMGAYFAGLLGGALTGAHVVNRVGSVHDHQLLLRRPWAVFATVGRSRGVLPLQPGVDLTLLSLDSRSIDTV